MTCCVATLENTETGEVIDLLPEFNVTKPYVKKKRKSTKQTSKAFFVQTAVPLFIHGEGGFEWEIQLTTRPVAQLFYDLYCQDVIWRYTGCMGEIFLIEMREDAFQFGKAVCGRYPISGMWNVVCVERDYQLCPE